MKKKCKTCGKKFILNEKDNEIVEVILVSALGAELINSKVKRYLINRYLIALAREFDVKSYGFFIRDGKTYYRADKFKFKNGKWGIEWIFTNK